MRFVICGDDNDGDLKGCRRTGRCDRHHRLRGPARQGLRQARNHAKRVRDAARKLGYKINLSGRSLRSGRSDTITFLTSGIEGDYFSHLAMCVAEEVHKRGSHMLIELSRYLTDDNDLSYTFSDGIIAINAPRAAARASASSATIAIPTIPTSFPAHVIFVCGPPRRAGLPFDERDFIKSAWSIDGGIAAGRALAKKSKCKYNGLYCLNDGIALGILRGLATMA